MKQEGHLSNLSRADNGPAHDQQIPDSLIRVTSRRRISSPPRAHRLRPRLMEPTVAQLVVPLPNQAAICENRLASIQSARQDPTAKEMHDQRISGKELLKQVERLYLYGSRSPRLVALVHEAKATAIPLRLVVASAEYLQRLWESDNTTRAQLTGLTNYMASILCRLAPSAITLFTAIYYVRRLRKHYPKSRGEAGCSHRLFTVAMLIAHRYHECPHQQQGTNLYLTWSTYTHHIFSPADLQRMELEMVAFLKFELYISWEDFEYFVDRVYNEEGAQVVPRCLDLLTLARPVGWNQNQPADDSAVPFIDLGLS